MLWGSILISLIMAITGIGMAKLDKTAAKKAEEV